MENATIINIGWTFQAYGQSSLSDTKNIKSIFYKYNTIIHFVIHLQSLVSKNITRLFIVNE